VEAIDREGVIRLTTVGIAEDYTVEVENEIKKPITSPWRQE
jgi:hypothetical protein